MTYSPTLGVVSVHSIVRDNLRRFWAVVVPHEGNGQPKAVRLGALRFTEGQKEGTQLLVDLFYGGHEGR